MKQNQNFTQRHIGNLESNTLKTMLETVNVQTMDELIDQTVPKHIRLDAECNISTAISEPTLLQKMARIGKKNKQFKTYIGQGYYNCYTPSVIQRNVLENPSWYTAYTPYQAEISQGRLEALFHFQSMVCSLTGCEVANASLLDEATAAAEAMTMMFRERSKEKDDSKTLLIVGDIFEQVLNVLNTRAETLGITIRQSTLQSYQVTSDVFGVYTQQLDAKGQLTSLQQLVEEVHKQQALVCSSVDLLSLTLIKSPGEFGVDIVIGSSQRFGVPLGYGGPHAAFLASKKDYVRKIPGRIIGQSKDRLDKIAYRMALQTREQHIRKEKATSNICTAQALLANMAVFFAIYHGPERLKSMALNIHQLTNTLNHHLLELGFNQKNESFFDTLYIEMTKDQQQTVQTKSLKSEINFHYDANGMSISLDETTTIEDVETILNCFSDVSTITAIEKQSIPSPLKRTSNFLESEVFNSYHTETDFMRYLKQLENKDLALNTAMIPLGSCTMKLNAATQLMPLTWPEFASIHPFVPADQALGYKDIIDELSKDLATLTGFHGVSLEPNSGAQGEYAGLLTFKSYFKHKNKPEKTLIFIPKSAHGTNPASAAMAGFDIVYLHCDKNGNIDIDDLKEKAEKHKETCAGLMITYPSTHGVFEEGIKDICEIIHNVGGLVYMDGANMNAQVGLTHPAAIGADICHLNLHKTFAIPHGGGGPGMGPICCTEELTPYLPRNAQTGPVSSAAYGSALILIISYSYIKLLGTKGLTLATKMAILNANYIKERLDSHYSVLFVGKNNRVAHELIIDLSEFRKSAGIEVEDIAKRLIDYGFHAPTISWPVPFTMMIEPTESESKSELDRFCNALISIRKEIQGIIDSNKDKSAQSLLKNAPHTLEEVTQDNWPYSYTRQTAAFPNNMIKTSKFWPAVSRIDQAYGDRNLICSCENQPEYQEKEESAQIK